MSTKWIQINKELIRKGNTNESDMTQFGATKIKSKRKPEHYCEVNPYKFNRASWDRVSKRRWVVLLQWTWPRHLDIKFIALCTAGVKDMNQVKFPFESWSTLVLSIQTGTYFSTKWVHIPTLLKGIVHACKIMVQLEHNFVYPLTNESSKTTVYLDHCEMKWIISHFHCTLIKHVWNSYP